MAKKKDDEKKKKAAPKKKVAPKKRAPAAKKKSSKKKPVKKITGLPKTKKKTRQELAPRVPATDGRKGAPKESGVELRRQRKNTQNQKYRLKKKLVGASKKDKAEINTRIREFERKSDDLTEAVTAAEEYVAEVSELRRTRKNLYNKKYRLKKKLEKAVTKKDRQQINRRILETQNEVNDLNDEMGLVKEFPEIPEKKVEVTEKGAIQTSILPVWEGRDKLTDLIKGGFYSTYIIGGTSFKKGDVVRIYNEFSEIEDFAYTYGRRTPYVQFVEDLDKLIVEIDIP